MRAGIDAPRRLFPGLKIDTVVIRGVNDDELSIWWSLRKRAGRKCASSNTWTSAAPPTGAGIRSSRRAEILERLTEQYGPIAAIAEESSAPADRFRLADGTVFGIISSTTAPFCRSCDRSRLTADGLWFLCLYAARGTRSAESARAGASNDEIAALLADTWRSGAIAAPKRGWQRATARRSFRSAH